ncbi:D-xylose transporter XylE [Galbibacter pacificus]|uniref:D-xylose transporter XylE n=1 Tax=Galbibacter pacificus TaxID=2996052 RepID=A0ABT6FRD6_9FLAO|nr:D-xylose transporter XylE [Galbibacter pacificus]MDG3581720.1 D-xylose transporter XylE [Galbibacter pacificus]MDG3585806.1 D-xylose transporter XylE [Galbibacter pacificus]
MNQTNSKAKNVYLITAVASLGGLLFGYDTAVISGAVGALRNFFIEQIGANTADAQNIIFQFKTVIVLCCITVFALFGSFFFKFFKKQTAIISLTVLFIFGAYFLFSNFLSEANALTENLTNSILGFMVSSALVGCIIGAALGDRVANSMGRRNGLVLSAILFLVSALGSAYPDTLNFLPSGSLAVFILYRIIGGIGVGLASMLAPLYIAEMAPANIRGKLVSCNQLAIVGGMFIVYFVNYYIVKGQAEEWINGIGWRYMFLSECIPAMLFLMLLFFVPKTPRFQVLKGNEEAAVNTLIKYNGASRATIILTEIKKSFNIKKAPWLSYGWGIIVIGLLLSVFQQFVGINVVLYYAPEIFKGMGMKTDASMLQTIIVGAINLLFTIVAIFTVDKFGRKILMLIGSIVMAISMIGLGTVLYAENNGMPALLLMLLYIAAFAVSWGPVTWVLLSEIFPNKIKGAMAVAVAIQWLANLIVSWTFPMMNNNAYLTEVFHHGFSYWVYGIMAVLSAIFIWKFVPETKEKTLEEMEGLWEIKKKVVITTKKAEL